MDNSNSPLRNRTVGRNTSSSYRDFIRIRPTPYPLASISSSLSTNPSPPRRYNHYPRLSLSPPKRCLSRSPTPYSDRFIPHSSSPVTLRHILSSSPPSLHRDGSQSPTNPQLHSPGKQPEWPNSYDDTIHSHRLASALEIPISPKLLHFSSQPSSPVRSPPPQLHHQDETFLPALLDPPSLLRRTQRKRSVPPDPFRILDAPELRDDYYAQPLSWSLHGSVAVALGMDVYIWTPGHNVSRLPSSTTDDVTSLAFSPTGDILAIARENGSILLHSPNEKGARVHIAPIVSDAVGALAWRPSRSQNSDSRLHEFLIIGAFDGQVVLIEVTWYINEFRASVEKKGVWSDVHSDQICGIAWSNDGLCFATGANDNKVCTFEIPMGTIGLQHYWEKKYQWTHNAAVKALAFKSGKGGILAAGGGVHDKKIRFYNTFHGTLLSSLDVDAQITTLIWSPNTSEILATFGYTAPGTSTKCAVYAYPSLQCLFAFEIVDEIRALYAVVSPNGQDICLAGSDECVRFYRIWGNHREERDKSPVHDLVEGVDTLLYSEENGTEERGRLRYGLSVIR